MANRRRGFGRRPPFRSYRKIFVLATEGQKTEPAYFAMFNSKTVQVKILESRYRTAPLQVLDRAKQFARDTEIRKGDEVWLVIDRDNWTVAQLREVFTGCRQHNFSLAVSNPCFEYWLLLHFEDGRAVFDARSCRVRLQRYLPEFDKGHVEISKLRPGVVAAIDRAAGKDRPSCRDWPRTTGSTVYRLVRKLQGTQ
ncbi:MAG: hypothetical protein A2521_16675 [Deltaproteobacteria bacterium RIFOXYD12_FULL_57_12]|nr:MAG: hypothetical protein A2521_16675 [Deltaproteobacteria bacterium RIFOXYD12_FULL_57_12]